MGVWVKFCTHPLRHICRLPVLQNTQPSSGCDDSWLHKCLCFWNNSPPTLQIPVLVSKNT